VSAVDLVALRERLMEVDQRLIEQVPHALDCLAPGLTEEQIHALAEPLPFNLPGEVIEWFRWHNGEAPSEPEGLPWVRFPPGNQYPLARAISKRLEWVGRPDIGEGTFYEQAWLPLIGEANRFLVADCAGGFDEPVPIHVVDAWPDEPWADVQATSVTDMVEAYHWAFDTGAWRWDPDIDNWDPAGHQMAHLARRVLAV